MLLKITEWIYLKKAECLIMTSSLRLVMLLFSYRVILIGYHPHVIHESFKEFDFQGFLK